MWKIKISRQPNFNYFAAQYFLLVQYAFQNFLRESGLQMPLLYLSKKEGCLLSISQKAGITAVNWDYICLIHFIIFPFVSLIDGFWKLELT